MSWNPNDSTSFKKDISPGSKNRWAAIANSILKQGGDESKAIRIANLKTRSIRSRGIKET